MLNKILNNKKFVFLTLNFILLFTLILLLVIAHFIEKPYNDIKAEKDGQRVVFSIRSEKIISTVPIMAKAGIVSPLPATTQVEGNKNE